MPTTEVLLSEEQSKELSSIAQSRSLPAGYVFRARLILMLAEGATFSMIQKQLRTTAPTISCRKLAADLGVSRDTVHRTWREAGLKPHRLERDLRNTKGLSVYPNSSLPSPKGSIVAGREDRYTTSKSVGNSDPQACSEDARCSSPLSKSLWFSPCSGGLHSAGSGSDVETVSLGIRLSPGCAPLGADLNRAVITSGKKVSRSVQMNSGPISMAYVACGRSSRMPEFCSR
jgi:hypothetical protein